MGRPKVRTADVRDDVLRCALEALERDGPLAVTARRVAESAGTSTAALYEFFGDKVGLVRAVSLEGFAALARALDAVPPDEDARRELVALLAATRRFALDRPMLFELMYARPIAALDPGPADRDAAIGVYRTVVAAVRRWLGAAGSTLSATEAAHVLVAAHRGFVLTELGGIAGSSPASVERRYRRGVAAVLDGLLAGSEQAVGRGVVTERRSEGASLRASEATVDVEGASRRASEAIVDVEGASRRASETIVDVEGASLRASHAIVAVERGHHQTRSSVSGAPAAAWNTSRGVTVRQ